MNPRRLCHHCQHIRETRWSLDVHAFLCEPCHHELAAWIELHPHLPTTPMGNPMSTDQAAERMFCYLCNKDAAEILADPLKFNGQACCVAAHECGYGCTRAIGHDGPHEATTSATRIAARWSA